MAIEINRLFDFNETHKGGSTINSAVGSSDSLVISNIFKNENNTILVICENDYHAEQTYKEIKFYANPSDSQLIFIPDTETLPYDQESPHPGLISERARAFHGLAMNKNSKMLIVTSVSNMMRKTSSMSHWKENFVKLETNQKIDIPSLKIKLLDLGYKENPKEVSAFGEFLIKNEIIDIYPTGAKQPIRIKTKDGTITSVLNINLNTQRSTSTIDGAIALAAREIPVNQDAITCFQKNFRKTFGRGIGNPLYEAVSSNNLPLGIEYYLPLFQNETSCIFDYLNSPSNTTIVLNGKIEDAFRKNWNRISKRYADLNSDNSRKIMPPETLWISEDLFNEKLSSSKLLHISKENESNGTSIECQLTNIQKQKNIELTICQIEEWILKSRKVIFSFHSSVREDQLKIILEMMDEQFVSATNWENALENDCKISLVTAPIDTGFHSKTLGLTVITEKELFGQPIYAKNEENQDGIDGYSSIQDLKNLELGDPIVHIKYGVGRFSGLTAMQFHGVDREYLKINFAKDACTYVPMDELDFVSRYGGINTENAPLDEIGSEKWLKGLNSAIENIEFTAYALLKIQAERSIKKGTSFKTPTFEYAKFCKEFPFQETRDQKLAITDIIKDMVSNRPMDRTVVGDVGFGKTEVAMRAAFIAASNGYQVAIMVPTTLLAQQHFENFKHRFSSFNINIKYLSKNDRAEEKLALKAITDGSANIVIGTHRLLQDDIKFAKLGLLVIDEEHRFGVAQKEKLRKMRQNLDVLTMTATPIPRTLSMSMSGIRDLSIIATPPAKRLSIRTIVESQSDSIVTEAIQRELMRNGQVFVLHNLIESIEDRAEQIRQLLPGVNIGVGHGKMTESELENVMSAFYRREYDVLVCTTIIETGIDVPNANTILIERSDMFGLAQLHQLRGRVGRSHHQAYAYLLTSTNSLSESAEKRLKAMEKATNLGEGFVLANHDLEIRGSGELLGEEQSGHIQNVGFSLYMRLLTRAIEIIKNNQPMTDLFSATAGIKLDINVSGLIDIKYIENEQERLSFYKRFASTESISELDEINNELDDRYGEAPEKTFDLININKLRCYLKQLGVKKLIADNSGGIMQISDSTAINIDSLLRLTKDDPQTYSISSQDTLKFNKITNTVDDRFEYLISLVTKIANQ
jgi:transcription-repair coupling factor (superfamily II helicase)